MASHLLSQLPLLLPGMAVFYKAAWLPASPSCWWEGQVWARASW